MSEELKRSAARAVADLSAGLLLASVEIRATPERVFKAIASEEIAKWWGSKETYRVTKWTGELKVGGSFRSEGIGSDGKTFVVSGEFLEIDAPKKLVHTWRYDWGDSKTTITYRLEAIDGGTRLTIRHEGFRDAKDCAEHATGWERVFTWLQKYLEA